MIAKFKKIITKKKCGIIKHIIPFFLVVLAGAMISRIYIGFSAQSDMKERADTIIREYLLVMEADGYLSSENKSSLENDLSAIGITVTGWGETTFEKKIDGETIIPGYGEKIVLEIIGKAENKMVTINGLSDIDEDNKPIDIRIKRTSTAKW